MYKRAYIYSLDDGVGNIKFLLLYLILRAYISKASHQYCDDALFSGKKL